MKNKSIFKSAVKYITTAAFAILIPFFSCAGYENGPKLIVGINSGTTPNDQDVQDAKELLDKKMIGGVILFRHNIVNPEQLKTLLTYIRGGNQDAIITIDQEGGLVSRLDERNGFPITMPAAQDYDSAQSVYDTHKKLGIVLKDLGINLNLSPVLDVYINPASPVIGKLKRSFSADPKVVTTYGEAAIRGLKDGGVMACGKHFPGHGSALADSHKGFADVTNTWVREKELYPFINLKDEVPFILVAHTYNANLDKEFPASLSKATYDLLPDYKGKFITDDYYMAAIANKYSEKEFFDLALKAGADLVTFGLSPVSLDNLKKKPVPLKTLVEGLLS